MKDGYVTYIVAMTHGAVEHIAVAQEHGSEQRYKDRDSVSKSKIGLSEVWSFSLLLLRVFF